jgi:hypothetical protein
MKLTTTAGTLEKGDKIGKQTVRYSTLHDLGHCWLVYLEGIEVPRRYGRNEPITVEPFEGEQ